MPALSNELADTAGLGPAPVVQPLRRSRLMRLLRAALAVAALVATTACDAELPAEPSEPLNISGEWRGSITVNGVPARMTWTLTHISASVTGPVLVALPTGLVLMNGALTGTLGGTTMTYTIAVPAGAIQLQPACSGQIGGTTTVVSPSNMNGTYAVTSSTCTTGLTNGSFTLTK